MKAISIKQPFAELIKNGSKTIETRLWLTKYRGDILICSSLSKHNGFIKFNNFTKCSDLFNYYNKNDIYLEYGYAICVANLYDVKLMIKSDEKAACCDIYDGAYSWFLNNVRLIEPFRIKGQLKLYNVDSDLIKYIL